MELSVHYFTQLLLTILKINIIGEEKQKIFDLKLQSQMYSVLSPLLFKNKIQHDTVTLK